MANTNALLIYRFKRSKTKKPQTFLHLSSSRAIIISSANSLASSLNTVHT